MTEPSHAVFLSYASQDAQAALRICAALRAEGIEVWLDQSELRGGERWDEEIRRQIRECALFIAIVSRHTQERLEGYFRREWKLAIARTRDMAEQKPFLVPVVVDGTGDRDAIVSDLFRAVQWTRLPGGEPTAAFTSHIRRLLKFKLTPGREPVRTPSRAAGQLRAPGQAPRWSRRAPLVAGALLVVGATAYFAIRAPWHSHSAAGSPKAAVGIGAFSPPAHSIAVLPFVNMSGDAKQEYFSDGLTEELLNSLTQINGLQVAARTSAFSFKGTNTDIGTIARKLNMAAVLEGSIRRSGKTVRVTTQLVNALTGFHLWSHSYDRDLGDVLKLETDIADAVAGALKLSLLSDVAAKIELGGTRNSDAFDAYLRGRKAADGAHSGPDFQPSIAAFTEAIRVDPHYALAFAGRSFNLTVYASQATGVAVRENYDRARSDALEAIALAPELAEGHLALAIYFEDALDFARANAQSERALALAPGNARVVRYYGLLAVQMGRTEAGIAAARRATVLDPLSRNAHANLAQALYFARRHAEAIAAAQDALALDTEHPASYEFRGFAYYALGNFEAARASCESKPDFWASEWCLAVAYDKLGRHADAGAQLARLKASQGSDSAFQVRSDLCAVGQAIAGAPVAGNRPTVAGPRIGGPEGRTLA